MKLVVISGRSGSGKSTALRALEDAGYNCIDNFPIGLLQSLIHTAIREHQPNVAVCVDARNTDLDQFPDILLALDRMDVHTEVIYLDALSATLVKRFSETRRRHPLTRAATDLLQAIDAEEQLLESIADLADLRIDTTLLDAPELTETIKSRVVGRSESRISLLFRSFGFKYGVPVDADMVFDIRCLPNPHWVPELRERTGLDADVADYLCQQASVTQMFDDIRDYLQRWIPEFEADNRAYLTVAIGCTGGQHRSVYLAKRLGSEFAERYQHVMVRHRELDRSAA